MSCGCALLPLKTKVKGPAAPCPAEQSDIVDEALSYFRANVLFRNFQPQSAADLSLCYLTVYVGELLRAFSKCRTKDEAKKQMTAISMSTSFAIPGDKQFVLPGFFQQPASRQEGEAFRAYFRQAREETAIRLVELAYSTPPTIGAQPAAAATTTPSPADAPQNKCTHSHSTTQSINQPAHATRYSQHSASKNSPQPVTHPTLTHFVLCFCPSVLMSAGSAPSYAADAHTCVRPLQPSRVRIEQLQNELHCSLRGTLHFCRFIYYSWRASHRRC